MNLSVYVYVYLKDPIEDVQMQDLRENLPAIIRFVFSNRVSTNL